MKEKIDEMAHAKEFSAQNDKAIQAKKCTNQPYPGPCLYPKCVTPSPCITPPKCGQPPVPPPSRNCR